MHSLNNEQQTVVDTIAAMTGEDRLVVSGRAGSGKTFGIANAVADRKALFLAPTHPATAVLEQELTDKRHKVMTIHSAIGWYKDRDENLYDLDRYRLAKNATHQMMDPAGESTGLYSNADLIIVDEFSMVGSSLFGAVEEYANEFNLPVVYSGDRFQLPPIRDREVIQHQGFPTITLTESMRFSEDSEIFRLGEMLRDLIENHPDEELPCLFGGEAVRVLRGQTWMEDLINGYANGDDLLAVTYDNATLRRLRQKVRQVDHDRLCPGDVVRSKQTDELFRNGEQFTVRHVEPGTRFLPDVPSCVSQTHDLVVGGYTLSFHETDKTAFVLEKEKSADTLRKRTRSLHQEGKLDYDDGCRILDWVDQINRFELSALSTVHKSQGRSVDTAYIDTGTVLRKPNWLSPVVHKRLLYTAVTRACEEVAFYEMSGLCVAGTDDRAKAA